MIKSWNGGLSTAGSSSGWTGEAVAAGGDDDLTGKPCGDSAIKKVFFSFSFISNMVYGGIRGGQGEKVRTVAKSLIILRHRDRLAAKKKKSCQSRNTSKKQTRAPPTNPCILSSHVTTEELTPSSVA
jgi:hypothetical protein